MVLKGIYAGKPAMFQLWLLLVSLLFGAVLSSLIGTGIFVLSHGVSVNITQYPDMMRMMQLLSAIGTFLFPALAVAWLCSADPAAYLCIKRKVDTKILLLALVSMFLMSPAITLTALLNKQMILPEFMAPVESAGSPCRTNYQYAFSRRRYAYIPVESVCHRYNGRYYRRISVPWCPATDYRSMDIQSSYSHLVCRYSIQRIPFAVLRVPSPYVIGSIFRLFVILEQKHLDSGLRPFRQ